MNQPQPWQTVKKRKHSCLSPEIIENPTVNTQNRFQYLNNESDDMNMTETSERVPKPPPIFIHGVTNYSEMIKKLSSAIANEQYYSKTLSNNIVKINVNEPETYRSFIRFLRDENIIFHTYQVKQDRAYRIVIRHLHYTVPTDEIKEEIEKTGQKVRNIMNIRDRTSKLPLPLFFVDLEPKENNKDIYKLEYISNMKISIEPPRKKREIIQCTRCQEYGHSKSYCNRPFMCVKCGNQHDSKTCAKPRTTPPKCALCEGNHPANYKGCQVYKLLSKSKNPNTKTSQQFGKEANQECYPAQDQQTHVTSSQTATRRTYAQVLQKQNEHPTMQSSESESLKSMMESFLSDLKFMISQMMNQNQTILSLLTSLVNLKNG